MPDGNFEDYVVLSQDTLSHRGAALDIGGATVSTVHLGLSNSAGLLDLIAAPTGNGTVNFPTSGGTLLTNIGMSAGTSTTLASAFSFVNGNNVVWRLSSNSISAIVNSSLTAVNFSAGTTSQNISAVVFSNSNGVSFGLNLSTITASVATSLTNINVSAGTTSNNLSAVTFSNSNGVSFGLNASTVTASVATSLTNINVSAGTTSNNLSAVTFSNSNGISFGLNGSVVTASAAAAGGGGAVAIAAGTQTATSGTVIFSNSNGISFGMSGSATVTAVLGGLSSWAAGPIISSHSHCNGLLRLNPVVIQHNLTVTNILYLASLSCNTTASGKYSMSIGLYSINGSTLSLASSASTAVTYTSGLSAQSQTGVQWRQISVTSWSITPGPYVIGVWLATGTNAILSMYNTASGSIAVVQTGLESLWTNLVLPGYSSASFNSAMPASIAISDTLGYERDGQQQFPLDQPALTFLGT